MYSSKSKSLPSSTTRRRCESRCTFVPLIQISDKSAWFPNPVPLSTSLQDGRCYHESLCSEMRLNLCPSLFIRTANFHPGAVYGAASSYGHLPGVIPRDLITLWGFMSDVALRSGLTSALG